MDVVSRTDAVYRRIGWRLIPMLFLGYVFAYLDRINVGFAALQMKTDLGFTDAVYGTAAGIFFVGYLVFELPSNVLLKRIGARLTVARIMIFWGVISSFMLFVRTPTDFYVMRVLLGIFEAGFAPGVLLFLTFWFPKKRLAHITAIFLSGSTVAGLIGAPVSGLVLDGADGLLGLRGWQWLFLVEGLPAVLLGFVILRYLPDSPRTVLWLSEAERETVLEELSSGGRHQSLGRGVRRALTSAQVYLAGVAWLCVVCGIYAVSFWMPMLMRAAGAGTGAVIGLWSTIPYGAGTIGMILLSRNSDRTKERRWHVIGCNLAAAISFTCLPFVSGSFQITVMMLTIATVAVFSAMPILWAIPMAVFPEEIAPAGIAMVSSIGLIGGFLSPFVMGWMKAVTGNLNNGLYLISVILVIGAVLVTRITSGDVVVKSSEKTNVDPFVR